MYKNKSQRNENCANLLKSQPIVQWEWVIIMHFYSALHLMKSFLVNKMHKTLGDIESHKDIDSYLIDAVRQSLLPNNIKRSYTKLFWASMVARYYYSPYSRNSSEVSNFDDPRYIAKINTLVNQDYANVKNHVLPLI